MTTPAHLASAAALIADPARAAMLQALMAGEALTAGELARAAGIAPSTASAHLAALTDGALVAVHAQGRHRWFRIADEDVAAILESLMGLAEATRPARRWPHGEALRAARTCWDHLAGRLGVAVYEGLVSRGVLRPAPGGWETTPAGIALLERIGLISTRRGAHGASPATAWTGRNGGRISAAGLRARSARSASRVAGCGGSPARDLRAVWSHPRRKAAGCCARRSACGSMPRRPERRYGAASSVSTASITRSQLPPMIARTSSAAEPRRATAGASARMRSGISIPSG